jgi:glycosyltransferase involved in cell wall biosynthesis
MDMSELDGLAIDHFSAPRRSLRVAVVTETYPPEVNGVANTIREVVEGLQRRNHDIQLIRPRRNDGDAAGSGARFHEVLMRGVPIPRYSNLRMGVPSKRALVRLWSVRRPDVVHIATEGPLGWSALQAAMHLKLPMSSDFRTNFHAYSKHYGIGWLRKPIVAYLRKFHNRTHRTMVPTEALRRELEASGFRNLNVVGRGVDTHQFHPKHRSAELRARWGVAPNDLVVICVGRLAPEKNLDLLGAAFDRIRGSQPGARLVLVGDGPMRDELKSLRPGTVLAGQRTGNDLATHYASADLFLFPSLTETFGNVTVEALASGLPLVAFNYAAAAQLVRDDDNGCLVPLGDEAAFIDVAARLAADAPRRRWMGERACRSAAAAGWDGVVARFEAELLDAIRSGAVADGPLLQPARPSAARDRRGVGAGACTSAMLSQTAALKYSVIQVTSERQSSQRCETTQRLDTSSNPWATLR